MKQDCTLIATLPNLVNDEKVRKVLSNPWISEARFNTGVSTLMGVTEVVSFLKIYMISMQKGYGLILKEDNYGLSVGQILSMKLLN